MSARTDSLNEIKGQDFQSCSLSKDFPATNFQKSFLTTVHILPCYSIVYHACCHASQISMLTSALDTFQNTYWPFQLAALTCLLTLSSTAPASKHGQPNFLIDNNFTITAGGTHGNQGAHVITPATVSRAISISNSLATRDGVGSVVTGAGLDWYNSDFSTGNSGYDDPQYYYCFKGPASNFPPLANWMNFYDMFDLNQNDQMVYEESGPI